MKVTLEEIARMAGVSRGIVDRVYHNRGYVKAEKAELVRELLKRYNYQPNKLARALSVSQNRKRIMVILNSIGNAYFDDVIIGIRSAAAELAGYGLEVETVLLKGFETADQISALAAARHQAPDALILTPVNDPAIAAMIRETVQAGIPVITLNTDIDDSSRTCYIGCDYHRSGVMAGGFLLLQTSSASARVAVIQGSEHVKGHLERSEGFMTTVAGHDNIHICAREICNDDEELACSKTEEILRTRNPDYIYVVAGGLVGVLQAVRKSGSPVKVIANDLTRTAVEGLQEGIIQVTIFQQPYMQGYLAIRTLFENIYQDIAITEQSNTIQLSFITKYNLP